MHGMQLVGRAPGETSVQGSDGRAARPILLTTLAWHAVSIQSLKARRCFGRYQTRNLRWPRRVSRRSLPTVAARQNNSLNWIEIFKYGRGT